MNFADAIVSDLRTLSATLVEQSAEESIGRAWLPPLQTDRGLIAAAELIQTLTPGLLEEASLDPRLDPFERERTTRPVRAALPRSPAAWTTDGTRWSPTWWTTPTLTHRPQHDALSWMLWVFDLVRSHLAERIVALQGQLDEIEEATRHQTEWTHDDVQKVRTRVTELEFAQQSVQRQTRRLQQVAAKSLFPSSRLPAVVPDGPAWRRLLRASTRWTNREADLASSLPELLADTTPLAALPLLYERWCGLQLLKTFDQLGCRITTGQPMLALFMGGEIVLRTAGGAPLVCWVSPRIGRAGHSCGLRTVETVEQTPDFVLVAPLAEHACCWVLDATLSAEPSVHKKKGRYRKTLCFQAMFTVAGQAAQRRPVRSWAMAPLRTGPAQLLDSEGRAGVLPVHPLFRSDALHLWVRDVVDATERAWRGTL